MSILNGMGDISTDQRDAYLRYASAQRRANGEEAENGDGDGNADGSVLAGHGGDDLLNEQTVSEMASREQFILSVASDGYGKRTSSFEYRRTGRGGRGIANMDLSRHNGAKSAVVAAFPIEEGDQIMLVTDAGKLIRSPVLDVRIAGRTTRGVLLFRVAEDERVVSVERVEEDVENDEDGNGHGENGQGENGQGENGQGENGQGENGQSENGQGEEGDPSGPETGQEPQREN
ncbi:MAG: DNA gyrase C-terminal beta-propeller domain-containing protein, partial [Kiloniellales bacterium]|nr:DNA gyrase C-terminal beta-propeller domain-containing protein [Kiloniellales bacterium]